MKTLQALGPRILLSIAWCVQSLHCQGSASGGEFLDWLLGRNQQLIPIGSYAIPAGSMGQPIVQNYPPVVSCSDASPMGPACAVSSTPGSMPTAPVQVMPSGSPSGPMAPSLPVYPPTTSPIPTSNFQSIWNRTPVTYYRPVTSFDPKSGTTITQLVPCTSYEYQTQRVPIYAFRPIFGQGRTFYPSLEMYWNPNATAPVASSGSSSFISVPQAGMPISTGMPIVSGSALAGSFPPSISTPIVPSNPVPSYLPPTATPNYLAPSTTAPSYFPSTTTAPSYVAPATGYVPSNTAPAFPSPAPSSYDFGNTQNAASQPLDSSSAIGTGIAPSVPSWNATPPTPVPSGDSRGIADPESSIQPSLPIQPMTGNSTGQYQAERPRFGLSRVIQPNDASNPIQPAPSTHSETSVSGHQNPNSIEIPSRLQPTRDRDDLKAIPAPEGSDLSPRWNRGLLDSRDLTASHSVPSQHVPTERAIYIASPAATIAQTLAIEPAAGSASLRPPSPEAPISRDSRSKQPGRLLSSPIPPAPASRQVDASGWTAK